MTPYALRAVSLEDGRLAAGASAPKSVLQLCGLDLALDPERRRGGPSAHPRPAGLQVLAKHGWRRVRQRELDPLVGLK